MHLLPAPSADSRLLQSRHFSTVIHVSGRSADPTVRNRREQGSATAAHTSRLAAQGKAPKAFSSEVEAGSRQENASE
jgi:hypothetical protein